MKLTASLVLEYLKKASNPTLTIDGYKALGRELRDKYNLTTGEALDILNNKNVLEILSKYENKEAN